jgi:hypothetical protein
MNLIIENIIKNNDYNTKKILINLSISEIDNIVILYDLIKNFFENNKIKSIKYIFKKYHNIKKSEFFNYILIKLKILIENKNQIFVNYIVKNKYFILDKNKIKYFKDMCKDNNIVFDYNKYYKINDKFLEIKEILSIIKKKEKISSIILFCSVNNVVDLLELPVINNYLNSLYLEDLIKIFKIGAENNSLNFLTKIINIILKKSLTIDEILIIYSILDSFVNYLHKEKIKKIIIDKINNYLK